VPEGDASLRPDAGAVGPAPRHGLGHRRYGRHIGDPAVESYLTGGSTHSFEGTGALRKPRATSGIVLSAIP
jgi:hypothetical protein